MAKKSKPAKRQPITNSSKNNRSPLGKPGDDFEIEATPPPYLRGNSLDRMEFIDKLQRTVKVVKPGEAFIIPKAKRHTAVNYLKTNCSEYRYLFQPVLGSDDKLRVYCFEWQ